MINPWLERTDKQIIDKEEEQHFQGNYNMTYCLSWGIWLRNAVVYIEILLS